MFLKYDCFHADKIWSVQLLDIWLKVSHFTHNDFSSDSQILISLIKLLNEINAFEMFLKIDLWKKLLLVSKFDLFHFEIWKKFWNRVEKIWFSISFFKKEDLKEIADMINWIEIEIENEIEIDDETEIEICMKTKTDIDETVMKRFMKLSK